MLTHAYATFRSALLQRKMVTGFYQGRYRDLCPHVIGHTDGLEKALVFQFAGDAAHGPDASGEWCCVAVGDVQDTQIRPARWHAGGRADIQEQTGVRNVEEQWIF